MSVKTFKQSLPSESHICWYQIASGQFHQKRGSYPLGALEDPLARCLTRKYFLLSLQHLLDLHTFTAHVSWCTEALKQEEVVRI